MSEEIVPGVELSVVLPMFNESVIVERSIDTVRHELERLGATFEIICVDDGSTDDTFERLLSVSALDERVKPIALSRNFGKESALTAGLGVADGEAVLLMDADMQHPPELVPRMVELWRQGYDVVNGVKQARAKESFVYRMMAAIFNLLMAGASGSSFRGASDFKLLDRQVVDAVLECPERNRFFRGLVAWVGFRTAQVPFTVAERTGGTTKWSVAGLVKYSLRNLLAFSALPLRIVAMLGFCTLIFAGLLAVWTLYRYIRGDALSGFTTVILLQLILDGLLLTCSGVIALYFSEMYDELKQRPIFLVRRERQRPANRKVQPASDTVVSTPES